MTAFESAWSLLKIDEGLWEEIYSPLYEVLGGRGKNRNEYAGHASSLDFVPTEMLPPSRHFQGDSPSSLYAQGRQHVEELMESIMEHGMLGRDSPWWRRSKDEYGNDGTKHALEEGRKRYDAAAAGLSAVGNVAIPKLGFTPSGWGISEGNHRVDALRQMGAPYIPAYMGAGGDGRFEGKNPQYHYDEDMIYGEDMRRLMALDSDIYAKYPEAVDYNLNERHRRKTRGYGIPATFGRRGYAVPPSFFFGRELVPGMGRLIPDLPEGLTARDIPLEELYVGDGNNDPTGAFTEFQNRLRWRVA